MINLVPGPVQIAAEVGQAFQQPLLSHREETFLHIYSNLRRQLEILIPGTRCTILTGSGTLANDVIAANAKAIFGDAPGLVLTNGEFGERLAAQARRAGLFFETLRWAWGEAWNFEEIAEALGRSPKWIWAVHLETSTGHLNDLHRLDSLCKENATMLMADCVSSLGATSLAGLQLFLASGVSGKSLGSYAGLALVFASEEALCLMNSENLPSVFDIASAIRQEIPMFTLASPQVVALQAALKLRYGSHAVTQERFQQYAEVAALVRRMLLTAGLPPLVQHAEASPVVATFRLPPGLVETCAAAGFRIAHQSDYLRARGWGQISVMGDVSSKMLRGLPSALTRPFQSEHRSDVNCMHG